MTVASMRNNTREQKKSRKTIQQTSEANANRTRPVKKRKPRGKQYQAKDTSAASPYDI